MNISNLDEWMFLSGTSENRLAKLVGVSRSSIIWWRSGRKYPTQSNIIALDRAVSIRNQEMLLALALSTENLESFV